MPLFARGRHGAMLTSAGERILYHARQTLQHIEMMQQEANLHKGLHGGHVRIAAFRSVATHLLPKAIAKFHSSFPEVAVTIIERYTFVDVEQCLREGRADIGITCLPTGDEFRVMGVAILYNALQVPAVFTFIEMLRKFDFQSLAKSTYS